MSTTLLLRLEGPMQSWGINSRMGIRDTGAYPSKSGVIGLIAAALGRPREEPLDDLTSLTMSVRIDRPGHLETDYQTAMEVAKASGATGGTMLSHRHYLADASFLVAFEGDQHLLETIHRALAQPVWPLFLGRKGYVASPPIYLPTGLQNRSAIEALKEYAWPKGTEECELIIEVNDDEEGLTRRDVPLCFAKGRRRFGTRKVRSVMLRSIC